MQIGLFSGKTGQVSVCWFCAGPGGLAIVSLWEPCMNYLLDPYGLVGLTDASPTGLAGTCLSGGGLKSWGTRLGVSKSLTP